MAGVGIIANPHARLNKKSPERTQQLAYIAGQRGKLSVTASMDHLGQALCDFKAQNIAILAIGGGDGTLSRTLTTLCHVYGPDPATYPKIAVLGGGTINTVSGALGLRGSPETRLYHLLEACAKGLPLNTRHIRTLAIENRLGFLYADGITAHFLELFYRNKSSASGALLLLARLLASSLVSQPPFSQLPEAEAVTWAVETPHASRLRASPRVLALLAATIPTMPYRIPYFDQVTLGAQSFHLAGVLFSRREIAWALLPYFLLRPTSVHPKKWNETAQAVVIGRAQPFLYTVDGELYRSHSPELTINCGPQFEFLTTPLGPLPA